MTKDMTKGNELKLIFLFTLPIMAGNFLQQLYNTVDGVIVGRYVSETALAAVGTCTPLTILFLALAIGLSAGCSIMVAQYFGGQLVEDLRKSVSTALILVISLGAVLSVAGFFLARPLLTHVLRTPDSALEDAVAYFSVYCLGLLFQFTYNIIAAVLRAIGDSRATLFFLLVSSLINIVLDLLFVAVWNWSVTGAAVATVIAQAVSAAVSLIYMFRRHPILRFKRSEFVFDREKCSLALKLGIPTTIQQCIVSVGHIAVQRLVNSFGTSFMASYTAAMRLENYIMIPIFGFNTGLATYTGQNMGAKRLDRVVSGYKKTLLTALACCVCLIVIALLGARPLVGIFGLTGESLNLGVQYLTVVAPFLIIFTIYQITCGVLQGSGDVYYAMLCTITGLTTRVITSYSMAYLTPLSYRTLWWSIPVGWTFVLVLAQIRYWSGKWKTKGIIRQE